MATKARWGKGGGRAAVVWSLEESHHEKGLTELRRGSRCESKTIGAVPSNYARMGGVSDYTGFDCD